MAYTGVYVFGDSLVDAGNALKLAQWYGSLTQSDLPDGAPTASNGYFEGRFSDGYTYAELISNKYIGAVTMPVFPFGYEDPWLGLPIAPLAGDPDGNTLNFAYGGAQIIKGGESVPDLDGQVDAFRDAIDESADSGALHLITMGGNDVRSLVPADGTPQSQAVADARLSAAAAEMADEVQDLISLGARTIVVTGVPNVGLIPQYDSNADGVLSAEEQSRADTATRYSQQLDSLIQTSLQDLRAAFPEATIHYVSFTDATSENLATLEALYGRQIDFTADRELIFFDQIHPNARSHALLAASFIDGINGVAGSDVLPLTAPVYRLDGTIGAVGEVDTVVIALAANATYSFQMLGISALGGSSGVLADPVLRLVDGSARLSGMDDDSGVGLDSSLTFAASRAGTYVLQLSAVGSLTGSYAFQAAGAAPGNDTYVVTDSSALILERDGQGTDTVKSSVHYALAGDASIETMIANSTSGAATIDLAGNEMDQRIVGHAGSNWLVGNGGNDRLEGRDGDDRLEAGAGHDRLEGGAGVDRMYGGAGNDIYVVSDSTDYAYEVAGEGVDRVYSYVTHTLRAEIEHLTLIGTSAVNASGNDLANTLVGNLAANVLKGGLGNDRLSGQDGADVVSGGDGRDWLEGGAARDRFYGGAGADQFVFRSGDFAGTGSGADQIHDFSRSDGDRIRLDLVDADVHTPGDQAFTLIGAAGFSGAAGELRAERISKNTYLQGDTNGDGVADFWIRVDGMHDFVSGDFVL